MIGEPFRRQAHSTGSRFVAGLSAGAFATGGAWVLLESVSRHIILASLKNAAESAGGDLSRSAVHYVSSLLVAAIGAGFFGGMVSGVVSHPRSLMVAAAAGATGPLLLVPGCLVTSTLFHVPDLSGVPVFPAALVLAICGFLGGVGSRLIVTRYPNS